MVCHVLLRLIHDEGGATAIEYSFIASLVSFAILGAAVGMRDTVLGIFRHMEDSFVGAVVKSLSGS